MLSRLHPVYTFSGKFSIKLDTPAAAVGDKTFKIEAFRLGVYSTRSQSSGRALSYDHCMVGGMTNTETVTPLLIAIDSE